MNQLDPFDFLIDTARTNFAAFVTAVHRPRFRHSHFSAAICTAVDQFVDDVIAGERPVLILTAPPQHGKSSLISRCLPPYLFGRLTGELPAVRIACASYAQSLANRNRRDAQNIMLDPIYRAIFPETSIIGFRGVDNQSDGLQVPNGGWLRGVGAGGGMTGFSSDIGIIDDILRNSEQALSDTIQERNRDWFDSVFLTRLQKRSGVVIIGTPWSADDLLAHAKKVFAGQPRLTVLSFPALNEADEVGFDPALPLGPLVPALHDEKKLREIKSAIAPMWWSSMYQQAPLADVGAIFKRACVQYYRQADAPAFQRVVMSVDAAFKGNENSDYVACGVWGRTQDNQIYLIDWRREKLDFMATSSAIADLKLKHPAISRTYIEDAANGPALISMLKKHIQGIEAVKPLGSKEARAHAVSWVWNNQQVWFPSPDERVGVTPLVAEVTSFPDVRNDDFVDCMTIALQQLCVRTPIHAMITNSVLNRL